MQSLKQYLIRWTSGRTVETYRLRAASAADARLAFQTVPGVRVLSVELVPGAADDAAARPHLRPPPPPGPLAAAAERPVA